MHAPLKENTRIGLAIATGVAGWLAFGAARAWPVAFVAWIPLLFAIEGIPSARAFGLGWLSGVVMTSLGFSFVASTLLAHSGFSTPVCLLLFVALSAYQGLRAGLFAFLGSRAAEHGWPRAPAMLLSFAASELLVPLPFPFTFGAAVHRANAVVQVADLLGPIGVSVVVVATNVGLFELVDGLRRGERKRRALAFVFASTPALAALYGVLRIAQVDRAIARGEPLRVGIVQTTRGPDSGADPTVHVEATKALAARGAELVVWSEAVLPGPYPEADLGGALRASVTDRLGVPAIIGVTVARARDATFNAAVATDAEGAMRGRYDKRKLAPFGEYLPLGDLLPALYDLTPRTGRLSAGAPSEPLRVGGHTVATTICYEDILPSYVRDLFGEGDPALLVNLTNDGWFGGTDEPALHWSLSRSRAIEHRTFVVRATNQGVSSIVDPTGRVVLAVPPSFEGGALGDARWMHMHTLYESIGDAPWWFAASVALGFATFRRRPRGAREAIDEARARARPRARPPLA